MLCTAPKSNTAICAIDAALEDVRNGNAGEIPPYLRDSHYSHAQDLGRGIGYKYPHSYPNSFVKQQYLPDKIKDRHYYSFGMNKAEQSALAYRRSVEERSKG